MGLRADLHGRRHEGDARRAGVPLQGRGDGGIPRAGRPDGHLGVDLVWRRWKSGIENDDARSYPGNPAADGNYQFLNLDTFRRYKGIEVSVGNQRRSGWLQALASYTLSSTEGYWDDADQAGTYADNPFALHNYWGPAPYDYRHVVKFSGAAYLPWDVTEGLGFLCRTGAPYTVSATVNDVPVARGGRRDSGGRLGRRAAEVALVPLPPDARLVGHVRPPPPRLRRRGAQGVSRAPSDRLRSVPVRLVDSRRTDRPARES